MKYYWLIYLLIVGNITAFAQLIKVNSDTWSATDALGRKVCEYQDVGEKKKDKYVAMFYWTWHQGVDDTTYTVKNISEIVRKYPEAMASYDHPAWGKKNLVFSIGKNLYLGIIVRPIPGCYENMLRCWLMQGLMLSFLIVQMEV